MPEYLRPDSRVIILGQYAPSFIADRHAPFRIIDYFKQRLYRLFTEKEDPLASVADGELAVYYTPTCCCRERLISFRSSCPRAAIPVRSIRYLGAKQKIQRISHGAARR